MLEAAGDVDILVTNAGGPPPGLWSAWGREDFIKALDANMLTPIALMKALVPGMKMTVGLVFAQVGFPVLTPGSCGKMRSMRPSAR